VAPTRSVCRSCVTIWLVSVPAELDLEFFTLANARRRLRHQPQL
jgi:hypothetical protein